MSDTNRPNIIFMHSHNTGRYVQPYGHAIPAPNLQQLAEEGVLFRKAFSSAPTCSPSRASFLSGMFAHSCGMLGLGHRGFAMSDYTQHMVHTLKANGYETALAGVEHTAPDVATVGYDTILSNLDTNYPDAPAPRAAAEAVVEFVKAPHHRPFFVSMGLNETHRPLPVADPEHHPAEDARYCAPPRPLPDTPETRAEAAALKASVREMDTRYGAVLDALDETGLADDTCVFCFTDHGLQFPRNMTNLTDHGIGVYLAIRGPEGFCGGKAVDALVSLIDLAPTVYALAGIETPAFVEGKSLLPLATGEADALHEAVFAEVNYHAAYEPMRCVRTERYKYIRRYDDREKLVLPNVDDTPSKDFLLGYDWEDQPREQEMLYDLIFDPDEVNNLIDRPEMATVRDEMRARLEEWMTQTNDPLLTHTVVPAPGGSRVNDPDGRSPRETPEVMT